MALDDKSFYGKGQSWFEGSEYFPKQQHRFFISFGGISKESDGEVTEYKTTGLEIPPFFIKSVDRPNYEIGTFQAKYLFSHTFNFPKRLTWKPITIVFNDIYTRQYFRDINEDDIIKKLEEGKDPKSWEQKLEETFSSPKYNLIFLRNQEYFAKQAEATTAQVKDKFSGQFSRSTQLIFYKFLESVGYFNPNELDDKDEYLLRFRSYHFKRNMVRAFTEPSENGTEPLNLLDNNFSGKTNDHAKDYQKFYFSINEIDEDGYIFERWKIYNPLVVDIKTDKLDYSNTNILTYSVTLAYDWAELEPIDVLSKKRESFKKRFVAAKLKWDREQELKRIEEARKKAVAAAEEQAKKKEAELDAEIKKQKKLAADERIKKASADAEIAYADKKIVDLKREAASIQKKYDEAVAAGDTAAAAAYKEQLGLTKVEIADQERRKEEQTKERDRAISAETDAKTKEVAARTAKSKIDSEKQQAITKAEETAKAERKARDERIAAEDEKAKIAGMSEADRAKYLADKAAPKASTTTPPQPSEEERARVLAEQARLSELEKLGSATDKEKAELRILQDKLEEARKAKDAAAAEEAKTTTKVAELEGKSEQARLAADGAKRELADAQAESARVAEVKRVAQQVTIKRIDEEAAAQVAELERKLERDTATAASISPNASEADRQRDRRFWQQENAKTREAIRKVQDDAESRKLSVRADVAAQEISASRALDAATARATETKTDADTAAAELKRARDAREAARRTTDEKMKEVKDSERRRDVQEAKAGAAATKERLVAEDPTKSAASVDKRARELDADEAARKARARAAAEKPIPSTDEEAKKAALKKRFEGRDVIEEAAATEKAEEARVAREKARRAAAKKESTSTPPARKPAQPAQPGKTGRKKTR